MNDHDTAPIDPAIALAPARDPDPLETRRPDVAGIPVLLADGNHWHLARPTVRIRPRFLPADPIAGTAERVELDYRVGYPRAAMRAATALQEVADASGPDDPAPYGLIVLAAVELVKLCHAVTTEQAAALFELDAAAAIELAVMMLAMFRGASPEDRQEPSPEETPDPSPEEPDSPEQDPRD
jgi:hypothetical protein